MTKLRRQVALAVSRAEANGLEATLTVEQWQVTVELFEGRCVYCGDDPSRLFLDHFIPIARGGPTTAANCLPACPPCNTRKGSQDPRRERFWDVFPYADRNVLLYFTQSVRPGRWTPLHWKQAEIDETTVCGVVARGQALVTGAPRAVTCDECVDWLEGDGLL